MSEGRYIKTNDLYHHGIKGQKWGVRRFQKKDGSLTSAGKTRYSGVERREQMKKIAKRRDIHGSDKKTAEYASKNLPERIALAAKGAVVRGLVNDMLKNGGISSNTVNNIAKESVTNFVEQELRAMSVSSKYDANGKGKSKGIMSREDVVSYAFHFARVAAPIIKFGMTMKYTKAEMARAKNQRIFEQWGDNILEQSFDRIVGLSDDEWRFKD